MCPAGNGRSCRHISAVLYAVTLAWSSGVGGTTCTDVSQAWGRGASKSLTHEKLSDITFNRPSAHTLKICRENVSNNDSTPNTNQFLDHKDLEESVQRSAVKSLVCKGTMLYQILHAPEQETVEINDITHGPHNIDQTSPVTNKLPCKNCEHFYQKYICLSLESIGLVESKTKNQDSNLWSETRKLRITASKANSVPKSNRADPNKFINNQLYPRFKGNAATQHGKRNEPKAMEWFQQVTDIPVAKSGIVVCPEEPYFAASPDGIVNENTIIEIKCPTRPLQDLISSGKYDVILRDGLQNVFIKSEVSFRRHSVSS
ncbi:uncharacterized protein LOC123527393 [Mercenaria mercenaria]|uniref:uncharacterized protein LOC123527393 n=1 Tax=Mercenaria mercenaria TaxID=6596 RepID=UPI001E1D3E02|nr:uncharacterized protein LOC123527393 [Mercenaria mercenaria]XP_053379299.1 uncharacterized protein LOC123527393 [Mercenaria mercenaria]